MRRDRVVGIFPMKNGKEAVVGYAEEKDIGAIAEIIRSLRKALKKLGQVYCDFPEYERVRWLAKIKRTDAIFLVVEVSGRIVGYVNVGTHPAAPAGPLNILSIAIIEKYIGDECGNALVFSGITEAEAVLNIKPIALLYR